MVVQPLRRRIELFDDSDDIVDWMAGRNAALATRDDAEAAGRSAWEEATRSGTNVAAARPADIVRLGAGVLAARSDESGSDAGAERAEQASNGSAQPPERIAPILPDGPLNTPPAIRFATAKPGDSISKLVRTSDPDALGRFMSLNGLDGRRSTIYAGQSYAIPTVSDEAAPEEVAAGVHVLRQDNAGLAALRAARVAAQGRVNSDVNVGSRPVMAGPAARQPIGNITESTESRKRALLGGYAEGFPQGFVGAGIDFLEGLPDAGVQWARMSNPFIDWILSPPGQSASDQAARPVVNAIAHPGAALHKAKEVAHHINLELNPLATPLPPTRESARARGRHLGQNHGKVAFNVAPLAVGGAAAEGAEGLAMAGEATDIAAYLAKGYAPKVATYFAERYPKTAMGMHWVPRSARFPSRMGGGPLPRFFMESRFNVSKPMGASRGQVAERHYANDLDFHGGPLPGGSGKGSGWSGKRLKWQRNPPVARFVGGMPAATKGTLAGAGTATGNVVHDLKKTGQSQ